MQSEVEIVEFDVGEIEALHRCHAGGSIETVRVIECYVVDFNCPWSTFGGGSLCGELLGGRIGPTRAD